MMRPALRALHAARGRMATPDRWLAVLLALGCGWLLVVPMFSGVVLTHLIGRIFILSVFGMSYDILRGYTGVINLGHALFFGGGAYIAGIMMRHSGPTLANLALAAAITLVFSSVLAYLMGYLSFRSGGVVPCAMLTLAMAEVVRHVAEAARTYTGGADGLIFPIPELLRNRVTVYYLAFAFMVLMLLALRRFVDSPAGRVLQAIRENEQRAAFLGYDTMLYKQIALQVAGLSAGLAGVTFGVFGRFANTDLLSIDQTLNALLVTIVGGTGTLYGAIVGTAFIQTIRYYLLELRGLHPIFERWLLFFGAVYVVVVLCFPFGFIGWWKRISARWTARPTTGKGGEG
ncbi:MAG TPA: branched-chain amino acid ABC transporter permease [Bacillota bacterium]|nr:branched-chain amino acid ABC transporter permease [Bacillota bacterium]